MAETKKTAAKKAPATKTVAKDDGFSAEERAAMKQAAAERKKTAAGQNTVDTVLEAIAAMDGFDRPIAEGLHRLVTRLAPGLTCRTWYGFPAYALDAKGKDLVVYYQFAAKFKSRYGMVAFTDKAKLDDGSLWPISYAVTEWNDTVERDVEKLLKRALG